MAQETQVRCTVCNMPRPKAECLRITNLRALCVLCGGQVRAVSEALPVHANSAINRSGHEFLASVKTLNSPPPTLVPAFENQDELFSSAFSILKYAISAQAFPAASIAVTQGDRLIALKSLGHFTYGDPKGTPPFSRTPREGGDFDLAVPPATLFDLASVTKTVATTTMAMILYERGHHNGDTVAIDCNAGLMRAKVLADDLVSIDLGVPNFNPKSLPFDVPAQNASYTLSAGGET